jgi:hypothetical protein
MYTSEEGVTVGPVLYADDNLTPLSLDTADQLGSILDLYESFTGVSGLNININKSMDLCIKTPPALSGRLQRMGMTTPDTIKHLGLHLGKTISMTVTTTMSQIEPKAIKRRILATPRPLSTSSTERPWLPPRLFPFTTMFSWLYPWNPSTQRTSSPKFFASCGPNKWMAGQHRRGDWLPKNVSQQSWIWEASASFIRTRQYKDSDKISFKKYIQTTSTKSCCSLAHYSCKSSCQS